MILKTPFAGLVLALLVWSGPAPAAPALNDIRGMMEAGELGQARAALEDYLGDHAGDPKARFLQGLVLARLERRDEAIAVFKGLVRDFPELPEPYNNLAVLYAAEGQYEEARDALLGAIGTHPAYATAHENLGDIYARMAASAYDKALTLDAQNATAEAKLALVNELFPPARQQRSQQVSPTMSAASAAPAVATAAAPPSGELAAVARSWARAWSAQDVDTYLGFYSVDFQPDDGQSLPQWSAERRQRVGRPAFIEVELDDIEVVRAGPDAATLRFRQAYRSDTYRDRVIKTLELVREDGRWKIRRERASTL